MPEAVLNTYKNFVRECGNHLRTIERKKSRIPMNLYPFRPVILVFFGVCSEDWLWEGIKSKLFDTWEGGEDFVRTINIGEESDITVIQDVINKKLKEVREDLLGEMDKAMVNGKVYVYFVMYDGDEYSESHLDAISDDGFYSWCTEKNVRTRLFLMLDAIEESVGKSRNLIRRAAEKRTRFDGCFVFGNRKTDGTMLIGGERVEQTPLILSDILLLSNTSRGGVRLPLSDKITLMIEDRNKMLAVGYDIRRKPVEEIAAAVLEGIIVCAKRKIDRGRDEDELAFRLALSREGLLGLGAVVRNDIENLYPEMREVDITDFPYTDKAADFIRKLCRRGRLVAGSNGRILLNHLKIHTQGVWNQFLKTYFDDVISDYVKCHEDSIRENVTDFLNNNIASSPCLGYSDSNFVNEAVNDVVQHTAECMEMEASDWEGSTADFFDTYGKAYGEYVFYREVKELCKEILREYGRKCAKHQKHLQNFLDACPVYEGDVREYYLAQVYRHAHAGELDVAQLIRPQDGEVVTAERLNPKVGEPFSMGWTRLRDPVSDMYGVLQDIFTKYVEEHSGLYAVGFEDEIDMREGAYSKSYFNSIVLERENMEDVRLLDFGVRYEKPQTCYIIRSSEDWSEEMLKKISGNVLFIGNGGAVEHLSLYPFRCTELQ